jgi:hypothetical protein
MHHTPLIHQSHKKSSGITITTGYEDIPDNSASSHLKEKLKVAHCVWKPFLAVN